MHRAPPTARGRDLQPFLEYLTDWPDWSFPVVPGESEEGRQKASQSRQTNLALLDTAILSIVGDEEAEPEEIIQVIADTLRGSLWERQLRRIDSQPATTLRALVDSRAQHLRITSTPAQRRGPGISPAWALMPGSISLALLRRSWR